MQCWFGIFLEDSFNIFTRRFKENKYNIFRLFFFLVTPQTDHRA